MALAGQLLELTKCTFPRPSFAFGFVASIRFAPRGRTSKWTLLTPPFLLVGELKMPSPKGSRNLKKPLSRALENHLCGSQLLLEDAEVQRHTDTDELTDDREGDSSALRKSNRSRKFRRKEWAPLRKMDLGRGGGQLICGSISPFKEEWRWVGMIFAGSFGLYRISAQDLLEAYLGKICAEPSKGSARDLLGESLGRTRTNIYEDLCGIFAPYCCVGSLGKVCAEKDRRALLVQAVCSRSVRSVCRERALRPLQEIENPHRAIE